MIAYIHNMKKYLASSFSLLLFLFLLSNGTTFAQETLFFDDFGAPPTNPDNPTDNAGVRKIWSYMPTGHNTFIFADPSVPDLVYPNATTDQAKLIENNFYAVVGPKYIYSSVYGQDKSTWPSYKLWETGLLEAGDITKEHNGNGGALVVNAGTTLSSLYVRFADLKSKHYYRLSYQLFVQNNTVNLKHQIISPSGNTPVAEYLGKVYGEATRKWEEVEVWFYMPEDCRGEAYSIALVNNEAANSGNDFAIDDLMFQEYEEADVPEDVKNNLPPEAVIECKVQEPVANNDLIELSCDDLNSTVMIDVLSNDKFNGNPIDINQFGIELLVPMGAHYTSEIEGKDWDITTTQTIKIDQEGEWKLVDKRVPPAGHSDYPATERITESIKLTFTSVSGFTGNPSPVSYRLVGRDGSTGNSNAAQINIIYDCNPKAVDDTKEVPEIVPGTSIEVDIFANDVFSGSNNPPLNPSDVEKVTLINPHTGVKVDNGPLIVSGEGSWQYSNGKLTFMPDAGFTKQPTPIQYTFTEKITNKTSNSAKVTIIVDDVPAPKNYWMGGTTGQENEWSVPSNWTAGEVPAVEKDVVFATVDNYGTKAVADLYLDDLDQNNTGGRVIGNLINDSDKDLVVTTGNQLIIQGKVIDSNPDGGTIIVKSVSMDNNSSGEFANEPTGTLIINPAENPEGVRAVVEFYNQAYDCADCGFYTRSWQYFGIPVEKSLVPPPFTGDEEVKEWSEPESSSNKWVEPKIPLTAFTGYEITRNTSDEPIVTETKNNALHLFEGNLNIKDALVKLTRTDGVNYSGVNLVGNSYTAAIRISAEAMNFPEGVVDQTVYLFNTGTRDQWRKLNGSAINQPGYKRGQYLAVPVNLGGQGDFPDRIPSMHAFMLRVESGNGGDLTINYGKLLKNTEVKLGDGKTTIVTRSLDVGGDKNNSQYSVGSVGTSKDIPSLVMDVIGEESADRVWIFAKEGASYGFDNGWDGRKMSESGISQFYVSDESSKDKFQVATVPSVDNLSLGFEADVDGEYTLEFALSDHWKSEEVYLFDQLTGERIRIKDGGSYLFQAKKEDAATRFAIFSSGEGIPTSDEAAKIIVETTEDGNILVQNGSSRECTVLVSDISNSFHQRLDVAAGTEEVIEGISTGIYIVRLQNAVVHDVRKVMIK